MSQPSTPRSDAGPTEIRITEPLCAVFRRRLKEEGQKYTPERAQILDTIVQIDDVFEAEQLQERLRKSDFRISKATIYRTLKLLQDAGIIQQVLIDSDQASYQLAYGQTPRDLLIRTDTHEVISFDAPELAEIRDRICRKHGLEPQGHRFHIFAVAPDEDADAEEDAET
jgi:Fur family ferric uptake transcriptional regulator